MIGRSAALGQLNHFPSTPVALIAGGLKFVAPRQFWSMARLTVAIRKFFRFAMQHPFHGDVVPQDLTGFRILGAAPQNCQNNQTTKLCYINSNFLTLRAAMVLIRATNLLKAPSRAAIHYLIDCTAFFVFAGLLTLSLMPTESVATHLYALKESDNCAGCHKAGRSQRSFLDRRCTLDCQGCHIDPAGAGPRNQWGYYYSQSNLASINFFQPMDPLQDTSRVDLHFDGRIMQRSVDGGNSRTFPMSNEFSGRLRPFIKHLHATYQALFLGRVGDESFRSNAFGGRRYQEKYSLMIDELPLNTYVRSYRGLPMYGIRRSNHSLWIRERVGLDQFAQTDAMEIGTTPNVPFFRGSFMKGDPYTESAYRQAGSSAHAGLRGVTAGWHLNGSNWDTKSDFTHVSMSAAGGGAHLFGILLYGERNWRKVSDISTDQPLTDQQVPHVQPSSVISEYTAGLTFIPGVIVGVLYETMDAEDREFKRRNAFFDFHPIPFLHFEIWRRFESGARELADTLGILHLYADF